MTRTSLTSAAVLVASIALLGTALPALADTANASTGVTVSANGASASVNTKAEARTGTASTKGQERAQQELSRRTDALTKLQARISEMQRLSGTEKSNLSANITAQINTLTALEAKIASDTDAATLKADIESITKSYRIFALIMPQASVAAAADRVGTIVSTAGDISAKLSARITEAHTAGHDTAAVSASLTDMNAKTTDANVQAQTALTETANLQPDNGDATLMASNTAALKDARTKIQAAQTDLKTAKADAESIATALRGWNVKTGTNATTTKTSNN